MIERINHPPHYNKGAIECIEALKAALSHDEFVGFLKGSVIKYLWRANYKGRTEDILKAQWYINYVVEYTQESDKNA